jgi:hypothetical protein
MTPEAVVRLEGILKPDFTLLELGSGASTEWYAGRVHSVVSIEPDQEWFEVTETRTASRPNVELLPMSVAQYFSSRSSSFDVVIVDHTDETDMTRPMAVEKVRGFAKVIVLDDSDRESYSEVDRLLSSWRIERFVGLRSWPLRVTETTIYHSPT